MLQADERDQWERHNAQIVADREQARARAARAEAEVLALAHVLDRVTAERDAALAERDEARTKILQSRVRGGLQAAEITSLVADVAAIAGDQRTVERDHARTCVSALTRQVVELTAATHRAEIAAGIYEARIARLAEAVDELVGQRTTREERDMLAVEVGILREERDRLRWGVVANAGRVVRGPTPRWSAVMEATGYGSTAAWDLCRAAGFDPDEKVGVVSDEDDEPAAEVR